MSKAIGSLKSGGLFLSLQQPFKRRSTVHEKARNCIEKHGKSCKNAGFLLQKAGFFCKKSWIVVLVNKSRHRKSFFLIPFSGSGHVDHFPGKTISKSVHDHHSGSPAAASSFFRTNFGTSLSSLLMKVSFLSISPSMKRL